MPVGDPSPPTDDPLIGKVLSDRYRIVRKIGEGGMGAVYQAEHALIEKKIALKILFQDLTRRPDLIARFLQEAKSASRIGHENVIDISDFGQSPDGLVFIAMEYLDGQDLGKLLRKNGAMSWERARPILMQIAKGLRAAHGNGIIHRDMKPENVYLVQREGRPDFVKVLDFGIAKIVNDDAGGPALTQTGMIFGTPEYMSPEQAQGSPPDHRVDIYAVGCIMYHMLTGSVPFTADNFMGILTKHLLEAPVPPRKRRPELEIPGEIEAICLHAMEKDRDKRYPDMDAFYRALGAAGDIAFEPSQVFAAPRLPKASLKYPTLTASNPEARESRTAIAAAGTGSFEDERPVRAEGASASGSKTLVIAAIAAAVVVAIVVGVFALRPSGPAAPASPSTSAATAPVAPAAPPAVAPAAVVAPAAPAKPADTTPAAASDSARSGPAAQAGGDTPAPSKRSRRHRNESEDEPKADPLHRAIPVPSDPTPPELKGFPGNN
ncbi:MAG TPA: serine/threonine-protein kinase [Polyangia bacterium]|jgi:serine/threonine-protein kinase